jgi:hypothetical protein
MGALVGFLGLKPMAMAMDAYEASRCPGVTRVRVNDKSFLKDWPAYGACPRQGLTAPLKP